VAGSYGCEVVVLFESEDRCEDDVAGGGLFKKLRVSGVRMAFTSMAAWLPIIRAHGENELRVPYYSQLREWLLMEKCKGGLTWELTRHDVAVSYRGLIRCLCERPLMAWDGSFFYTVEPVATVTLPSKVADTITPAPTISP
jgi:hypothetical protein